MHIRKAHRIMGNLVGVTAGHCYDSTISGLPAVYSVLEAKLLIDEGLVGLRSGPSEVGQAVQEEYQEYMAGQLIQQAEKRYDKSRPITEADLLYQVPTECSFDQQPVTTDVDSNLSADPVKYAVFRDLWRRKYFITNGHSFGGDFLIYPQDPIICHASHVVHVLNTPSITAKDFIVANRLCVGVKKECLFAYQDPEKEGGIRYQSSVWDSTWDKWEWPPEYI